MTKTDPNAVFDYRALRLLMGLVAFTLPFATSLISTDDLPSISFSYYTEAHDVFICMLCIISTLLWAYNGHATKEKLASKAASLATLIVVIFPTSKGDSMNTTAFIHYAGAVVVFSVLIYFCLGPFRDGARAKKGKKGDRRAIIYVVCGFTMILSMLLAVSSQITASMVQANPSNIVYWTETISLLAFGIAWIVAGKVIPPLTEEEEQLKLSLKHGEDAEYQLSPSSSD